MPVTVISGSTLTNTAMVMWSDDTVATASSADPLYPAINVTSPDTFSSWKASAADPWIAIDKGVATDIDCVGISSHNLATSGISQVFIQRSSNGTSWTTKGSFLVTTDEDYIVIFSQDSFRHWRLSWNGPPANIGVLMFGKRLVFPHAPVDDYVPLNHARRYSKYFNNSIRGQFLSNRVQAAGAETDVNLGYVERTFVDGPLRPFESHYNQGGTFFYASCPAKYVNDMGYCRANSQDAIVSVNYVEADRLSNLSFGITSYVGT